MPVMQQPEAYLGHVSDDSFDESGCLKEGPLKELVVEARARIPRLGRHDPSLARRARRRFGAREPAGGEGEGTRVTLGGRPVGPLRKNQQLIEE